MFYFAAKAGGQTTSEYIGCTVKTNLCLNLLDSSLLDRGPFRLARSLERRRAVLEELLLPLVEKHRLDLMLLAQLRNRNLLNQMPLNNRYFLRSRKSPAMLLPADEILLRSGLC